MSQVDQINHLLNLCDSVQRAEVFRRLREEFPIHPLEAALHAKAEIILEAIHRASDLTQRMMRGVIAEAAFEVEVVERLMDWSKAPLSGNFPYDFLLKDSEGDVRVQVKLQRSTKGRPMRYRASSPDLYVVEPQKTRGGKKKGGDPTRPYRFGDFDLLAVATYPSTSRWDTFMYTVADWLLPARKNPAEILYKQPLAMSPNDDWTDDFREAVAWLRSGKKKTIRAAHER